MSSYDPTTCFLCNLLPLVVCDACGNQICSEHRSGFWPGSTAGSRLDYCVQCLTETNAPAAL